MNLHGPGTPPEPLDPGEDRYCATPGLLEPALDLAAHHADRVQVDFTFDDGNLSDIGIGAPLLEAAGRRATFFVLADRIGRKHYLGGSHLRTLVARGHRIGLHGAAHVDWTTLDTAGLARELTSRDEQRSDRGDPAGPRAVATAAAPAAGHGREGADMRGAFVPVEGMAQRSIPGGGRRSWRMC